MSDKLNIKLLIFEDDNGTVRDKHINLIEKDDQGVFVQFINLETKELYGEPFFLPWHKVSKIKEVKGEHDI